MFLRRLRNLEVLGIRREVVVFYVVDDVWVLSYESWVRLLLQLCAPEDLEVLHGDLDLEVVGLVVEELQVRLLLCLRESDLLFAFLNPS